MLTQFLITKRSVTQFAQKKKLSIFIKNIFTSITAIAYS